ERRNGLGPGRRNGKRGDAGARQKGNLVHGNPPRMYTPQLLASAGAVRPRSLQVCYHQLSEESTGEVRFLAPVAAAGDGVRKARLPGSRISIRCRQEFLAVLRPRQFRADRKTGERRAAEAGELREAVGADRPFGDVGKEAGEV